VETKHGLIIVPSGKFTSWDDAIEEVRLYNEIANALKDDYTVFKPPFDSRLDNALPATDDFKDKRYAVLTALLQSAELAPYMGDLSILSLSLGCETVLRMIADPMNADHKLSHLFICGTAVEEIIHVYPEIDEIHLIAGEMDYIGYYRPGVTDIQLHQPQEYLSWSAKNLITTDRQNKFTAVMPSCNHFLFDKLNNNFDSAVKYFTQHLLKQYSDAGIEI